MSAKCKLSFFKTSSLYEPIRYMLAYGNIDFEEVHLEKDESLEQVNSRTPWEEAPILEFGGIVLTQSGSICRYLAKQLKLTGSSKLNAAHADSIVVCSRCVFFKFLEALEDFINDAHPLIKELKLAALQSSTVPLYLSDVDKIVSENGGYFVNGQLTWADIYFVAFFSYMQMMVGDVDFFSKYPNLMQLKEKVENIPQIKAWLEKRPKTL